MCGWRDAARPIIARVLRETEGKPKEERDKALFDAYPFGIRAYHPYKVWLDEKKKQLEAKPVLRPAPTDISPNQLNLF
jgi:hypothetical protein